MAVFAAHPLVRSRVRIPEFVDTRIGNRQVENALVAGIDSPGSDHLSDGNSRPCLGATSGVVR